MGKLNTISKWKCDSCDMEKESYNHSDNLPENWGTATLECGWSYGGKNKYTCCASCLGRTDKLGLKDWEEFNKSLLQTFKNLFKKEKNKLVG